eukprot:514320-Pelagomonas_calceolata.AAC.5
MEHAQEEVNGVAQGEEGTETKHAQAEASGVAHGEGNGQVAPTCNEADVALDNGREGSVSRVPKLPGEERAGDLDKTVQGGAEQVGDGDTLMEEGAQQQQQQQEQQQQQIQRLLAAAKVCGRFEYAYMLEAHGQVCASESTACQIYHRTCSYKPSHPAAEAMIAIEKRP